MYTGFMRYASNGPWQGERKKTRFDAQLSTLRLRGHIETGITVQGGGVSKSLRYGNMYQFGRA